MKTVFNVLEYGASGDGCTMNTAAIAKAVAAVKAAGGGELYFPAGRIFPERSLLSII